MDLDNYLKVLGAILAIGGLIFTGYQIREARKTLVFNTEQALYKESRELLKFIADNPDLLRLAQQSDRL